MVATLRARTKSGAAAPPTPSTSSTTKKAARGRPKAPSDAENEPVEQPVEAPKTTAVKKEVKKVLTKGGRGRKKKEVHCLCKKPDDGTPMVKCEGGCETWYHFRCVSLSEDAASELAMFICPDCEARTGMKSVMEWEGPDAFEEIPPDGGEVKEEQKDIAPKVDQPPKKEERPKEEPKEVAESSASEDEGSEDDYVAEPAKKRARLANARRSRRTSTDISENEAESDKEDSKRSRFRKPRRLSKISTSPGPSSSAAKRRGSMAQSPVTKKAKVSEEPKSAQDDAMRKYCLTKLEEVIKAMFVEYPPGRDDSDDAGATADKPESSSSAQESAVTEETRAQLEHNASMFVAELETCLFDTYSEPDKLGKPHAGGKYKERFRMLTFNLSKTDRIILRRGIAHGRIKPSQLSTMSSTDLANEQTKHDIEQAEKEALRHSILQKITAPRAKITHKGLEDIEDVNGVNQRADRQREEQELLEKERMERERVARLRTIPPQQKDQQSSASPPVQHSPVTPQSASWGAPPPTMPAHASQHGMMISPVIGKLAPRPLFIPSASDIMPAPEDGLNLADLINIDDESPPQDASPVTPGAPELGESLSRDPVPAVVQSPSLTTPSGPSPFAPSQPLGSPRRQASFDLNALWSEKHAESMDVDAEVPKQTESPKEEPVNDDGAADMAMDTDDDGSNGVQDFDIFLGGEENGKEKEPQAEPLSEEAKFEALPRVWMGSITMPLDESSNLDPPVTARQVGGREIKHDSQQWTVLFPSSEARIDGRVPIDKSAQYLLTTRMNSTKELIAVCFTPPASDQDNPNFKQLITYLVNKDRHALVFPWGHHPKAHHPGREFYIIPLMKDQPLPEFIELLDNLHLPKARKTDLLIGMFILNKGRLVSPPPPPAPPAAPAPPIPVAPSTAPPAVGALPLPLPLPMAASTPGPPNPALIPNLANLNIPGVDPSQLAAEVASLTPEQIALMVRHLQSAAPNPPVLPPPVVQPPQIPVPGLSPIQYSAVTPPGTYPPTSFPPPPPPPPGPSAYGDRAYDRYDQEDYDYEYDRRNSWDERGGRGGRGRGRGGDRDRGRGWNRGRGRGGDRQRDRDPHTRRNSDARQRDSGWGGRGRGGGLGGGNDARTRYGEHASPPHHL